MHTYDPDLIDELVTRYIRRFPDERFKLVELIDQVALEHNLQSRATMPGHVTGSALVLSADRTRLLLIHHKLLNKWLQPGGHYDFGDASPLAAARREAIEETAVHIADYLPLDAEHPDVPFEIQTHPIQGRPDKAEGPHNHHDFRYVFMAADDVLRPAAGEVNDAQWMSFDDPRTTAIASSVERLRILEFI